MSSGSGSNALIFVSLVLGFTRAFMRTDCFLVLFGSSGISSGDIEFSVRVSVIKFFVRRSLSGSVF